MRLKLQKLWQLRPRLLTVALVAIVGAVIVLANLTDEIERRGQDVLAGDIFAGNAQLRFSLQDAGPIDPQSNMPGLFSVSYGWPLLWRQYIIVVVADPAGILGDSFSAGRLAANLALWLVMLAVPGAACEWLLRRHPPRFRWSLRMMLMAVAAAAALCAWIAGARGRADLQDTLIATAKSKFWMKHSGPRWLDLIGADRYRRRIVGARLDLTSGVTNTGDVDQAARDDKKELLARLSRLGRLRYLFIDMCELSPELVRALRVMRQLRALSLYVVDDRFGENSSPETKQLSYDCLAAIGAMRDLEYLSLCDMPFAREHLDCLGGLAKLQSLCLFSDDAFDENPPNAPLLSRLPALPRLETLDLSCSYVGDGGLRYLTVLPRLKRLNLEYTVFTKHDLPYPPYLKFDAGLEKLESLQFLEEVTICGDLASATGLESLSALKRLKALHVESDIHGPGPTAVLALNDEDTVLAPAGVLDRCRRALGALRKSNPGLVIDGWGEDDLIDWRGDRLVPAQLKTIPDETGRALILHCLEAYKKKGTRFNMANWPHLVSKQRNGDGGGF